MQHDRLLLATVVTSLAAATALSIAVVPKLWHEPPPQAAASALRLDWPELALEPPAAVPFEHSVKTEKYVALTIVPKSEPPKAVPTIESEASDQHTDQPRSKNICEKEGGERVITHHGRGWRCRYPKHRR